MVRGRKLREEAKRKGGIQMGEEEMKGKMR